MSPDARLIAATLLAAHSPHLWSADDVAKEVADLEAALPKSEPGIRGMVPVAYLKDVIEGAIARLEAMEGLPAEMVGQSLVDSPLAYLKRRLADVGGL